MTVYRFIIWILLIIILGGCTLKQAVLYPDPKPKPQDIRDRYVFIFLMDGARPGELDDAIQAGYLPTFKEVFYDNGARYQNAMTLLPTASAPAHQAFLSGLLAGHHGIPTLDWFSRPIDLYVDHLAVRDIPETNIHFFNFLQFLKGKVTTDEPQIIFRELEGYPTLTSFEPSVYQVKHRLPSIPPFWTAFKAFILKKYDAWDDKSMKASLKKLKRLPVDQMPRLSMVNFLGMDWVTHWHRPPSEEVRHQFEKYDAYLKELIKDLKAKGIWDKTTFLAISDHGQHDIKGWVNLPQMLTDLGFDYNFKKPKKSQVMRGDHGTANTNLYFRMGKSWATRPSYQDLRNYPIHENKRIDIVESILNYPDIQAVVTPEGPWKIHMHFDTGHALIRKKWTGDEFLFAYEPDPGVDPLGYLNNSNIKSWVQKKEFHNSEDWLKETAHEKFPDTIVNLGTLFDDYRYGDMMVLAVKDKQFREVKPSGHGSIYREDVHVPFMISGPDIKPGIYSHMRTVDTYPLLMTLFGIPMQNPTDGILRSELFKESFIDQNSWILSKNSRTQESSKPLLLASKTESKKIEKSNNIKEFNLGKSLEDFKIFLEKESKNRFLDPWQRRKAKVLLWSLENFQKEWIPSEQSLTNQ